MKHYKTLNGFFRNAKSNQVTIKELFGNRAYLCGKHQSFRLSDEATKQVSLLISEYLYTSKSRQKELYNALIERNGDFSFFQCFYLDKNKSGFHISNSLSGEAFDHCRRKFMQSI